MADAVEDFSKGKDVKISVSYKPYMIDTRTAKNGEEYMAYNRRRWGSDGWTSSLRDRGRRSGLHFASWKTWPNTLNAHRLCVYMNERDLHRTEEERNLRGVELMRKFYELTYERGENISTPEGASRALEELGYASVNDCDEWLRNGGGHQNVADADSYAKRELDIHGVPYFVVSSSGKRSVALEGAQGVRAFLQAFQKMST